MGGLKMQGPHIFIHEVTNSPNFAKRRKTAGVKLIYLPSSINSGEKAPTTFYKL